MAFKKVYEVEAKSLKGAFKRLREKLSLERHTLSENLDWREDKWGAKNTHLRVKLADVEAVFDLELDEYYLEIKEERRIYKFEVEQFNAQKE